jgi:hypothetical protein
MLMKTFTGHAAAVASDPSTMQPGCCPSTMMRMQGISCCPNSQDLPATTESAEAETTSETSAAADEPTDALAALTASQSQPSALEQAPSSN